MKKINIGITSIGSGVGQSVVDSCRLSNIPMKLIGYGMNPFAFGSFDCEEQKYLPSIYSKNYIEKLLQACTADNIDILIPGLDDELLLLAGNREKFDNAGVHILISGRKMIELCRDKELMSRVLNRDTENFVKSYSKEKLIQAAQRSEIEYPLIAKPISGFASRGLLIIKGPDDLNRLTDRHVIQEIAVPSKTDPHHQDFMDGLEKGIVSQVSEISLQLVIGKRGQELGRYASYNRLHNGVPIEIIPADVPDAWAAIDKILPIFHEYGLYGPLNIQGRITEKGPRFFEMNARFTGITGLRAMMGFNEVEAVIADAADLLVPYYNLKQGMRKIGMRQVKNRVVDVEENMDIKNAVHATAVYPWIEQGRTVMVTGANGYLGRAVLAALLVTPGIHKVIALVRNPARFDGVNEPLLPQGIEVVDISALDTGNFQLGYIDVICHLASGRPIHKNQGIAESLKFTQKIISAAIKNQVPGFINASSQSVYGMQYTPLWSEETPPGPETAYAQSKWASEVMASAINEISHTSRSTSLRFARLIGPSPVRRKNELAHKYVAASINGEKLKVRSAKQRLDLIDVRDAARLVATLAAARYSKWPAALNVSTGKPVLALEVAQLAIRATTGDAGSSTRIEIDENFIAPSFGMDNSKATQVFDWAPIYSLEETLSCVALELKNELCQKAGDAGRVYS